ncbi:MAG: single-stranded DNA-binding protein [Acidimicrobiales bacterium]
MPSKTTPQASERRSDVVAEAIAKVGNLTRDLELRYGANGTPFARSGLAVNRPKTPGDWRGEQVTDFYEVTCFGEVAEHAAECLSKGMRVIVLGRAEIEHWQDEGGEARTTKRIVAREVSPSLRWARLTVERVPRQQANGASEGVDAEDEEPF